MFTNIDVREIMKDILLITNYWHFECEKASSRYYTLANMIVESRHRLEIITSTFYHATKKHRQYEERFLNSFPYKITMVHEPGYAKNISITRLISHKIFAENVLKYIKNRKKPDVIYCVIPSLDVANLVAKYANRNNIKLIIDIQDLWPEAFRMAFDIPIISDLLFYPLKIKANNAYKAADEIVAVSDTYVERALTVNKKCEKGHSVYLGIELSKFDVFASKTNQIEKPSDEIWLAYIGALGHSYDLITVIDALKILRDQGIRNIKFIVMGDGPLKTIFKNHAETQNVNVEFTGLLNYEKMVSILTRCDIAVNPIIKNSVASIINKVADYAAAGLPVLNTQESAEYRKIIKNEVIGFNCENGNPYDLADKLKILCKNEKLRKKMGMNNRRLAERKFDRHKTYFQILELL